MVDHMHTAVLSNRHIHIAMGYFSCSIYTHIWTSYWYTNKLWSVVAISVHLARLDIYNIAISFQLSLLTQLHGISLLICSSINAPATNAF